MLSKWIQLLSPFALGLDFAFILQHFSALHSTATNKVEAVEEERGSRAKRVKPQSKCK